MGNKLFLDIETTEIQGSVLPSTIFCLVTICDKGNIVRYTPDNLHQFKIDASNYKEFIGHNIIGFDAPVIKKVLGVDLFKLGKVTDTLILSRLFNPVREGGHSLRAFGIKFGFNKLDFKDFTKFSQEMLTYCVKDVQLTIKVYNLLQKQGVNFSQQSIDLEHDVARIIEKQVSTGFLFDMEKAHLLLARLQEKVDVAQQKVRERFKPLPTFKRLVRPKYKSDGSMSVVGLGCLGEGWVNVSGDFSLIEMKEFNLGSRQQIGRWLQNFGWKPNKFTEHGQPIVDEKVLAEIKDIPEAELINEFLLLQKRIAMIESWIEAVEDNGRVHGRVITIGAITSRMSHQSPNMAQVPAVYSPYGKECRELWTVPSGYKLVGVDASGLELRILSHYMNNKEYINEVINGDIHSTNQALAGLETRDTAKTFIYAFIYGAGNRKLGTICGRSESYGRQIKERFLRGLPSLAKLRTRVDAATRKGFLKGLDQRCHIIRQKHSALNTLIQGAGAIVMKKALILLDKSIEDNNIDALPVANVHDEFQYQVKDNQAEQFGKLAVQSIVDAGNQLGLRCPLNGEYKIGNNWKETH
uniref:DNA-directed DNA polymerase n=1 Tax=uncultured virus TaxID=340016 RepID=A0A0A0V4G4_9VIRU|nr:DNA polymerase [uncultured virus]